VWRGVAGGITQGGRQAGGRWEGVAGGVVTITNVKVVGRKAGGSDRHMGGRCGCVVCAVSGR